MKRTNLILAALTIVSLFVLESCGGGGSANGQLVGAFNRPSWRAEVPYGMVTIPDGTLTQGGSDQDVNFELSARPKQVSIRSFYMDETEITNNEYRQFVDYIRDSIAHTILQHFVDGGNSDDLGSANPPINWKMKLDWKNQEVQNQLATMYLPQDQWINGKKSFDVSKFVYKYDYFKMKAAANGRNNRNKDVKQYVKAQVIPAYPDTLVWVRDFTYSYNEPYSRNYYSHPAFDDYPVVGVSWDQANAFSYWRSEFWGAYKNAKGKPLADEFRLPNEGEWEYAARGGKKNAPYPWGGPYTRNQKGCLLANFKPNRGNYKDDGGFYTLKVDSYFPNDYGLYNMSGNVSEWTSSAFYENSVAFVHDQNPDIKYDHTKLDNETMKRKVIRGGSWKDVAYYIQNGSRLFEYADSTKSYIGFRCVTSTLK